MMRISWRFVSTLVAVWLASATLVAAQDPKLIPPPQQAWTNVLADSRPNVEFVVHAPAAFKGRVVWTVSDPATKRVLPKGRGELVVKPGANVKFALDIPAVNPGVVVKAHLTVSLVDDANGDIRATHDKDLWIFPADPFHGLSKALAELKMVVYDPAGKSAAALNALKVPFDDAKNADALAERKGGVVVIGEGVSFNDEPGLAETLVRLAQQGATVICLAPSAAALPIPGGDKDDGESVSFFRHDAIAKLDPRLDGLAWSNCAKIVARTIVLRAVEGSVIGEVGDGPGGFPWMQIDYPQTNGRLTVCGFGLIAHWQETPTPRYLFAKMLGVTMPSPNPQNQGVP
jgi:hypothetical protein